MVSYFLYFFVHPDDGERVYFGSPGRATMAAQHVLSDNPELNSIDIMKTRTMRVSQRAIVTLLNGTGGFSGDEELARVVRRGR